MTPTEAYILNDINGASPEKLQVLLLTGVYRNISKLITALEKRDFESISISINKTSLIIDELSEHVAASETELANNLRKTYTWWNTILFRQSDFNLKISELQKILAHILELRRAWEGFIQKSHLTISA